LQAWAPAAVFVSELMVLMSLFAVGLRLRVAPTWQAWRVAFLMAGPGMVMMILLGGLAARFLMDLPWPVALLLASVLAPTDPVLASEVQIRHDADRDAVRLSLTAEGGLNDGTALPAVMLALGLMGLHDLGGGMHWLAADLLWPIGGGALLGVALGRWTGARLRRRSSDGDRLARDELLYVAVVALAYGLARLIGVSPFTVVFAAGSTLLWPFQGAAPAQDGQQLAQRLQDFGGRIERLVEAASVLGVGVVLHSVALSAPALVFGVVLVLAVRPLSVLAVVRRHAMTRHQRRLVAWFGIRGIGSLYYLATLVAAGVTGAAASELITAVLYAVALSIVLHGVSATPLMTRYQQRRNALRKPVEPPARGLAPERPDSDGG
jgi:NhaP-type Na+/H+ or K+/H+ antiporter